MKSFFILMLEKQSAVFDRDREQLRKQIRSSCFSNFQPFLHLFLLLQNDASVFGVEIKNILGCSEKEAIYPPIINSWGLEMLSLKLKGYKIDKRNTLRNFLFLS